MADPIAERDELERVLRLVADDASEVPLNVVCFRYRGDGIPEAELDGLNRRLGDAVLEDGRLYMGTTMSAGKVAFRPAIVNGRTREEDVDVVVPTVLELAAGHG